MKNIQRAAGYRRVSMREQVDGHSLDAQAVNIQTYAQQQGWEVVEIYTDAGLSAKKDSHRPALERLMTDAQAGRFEVIVVDKIDRFYRHLHGLLTALDQLNQAHVGFASVQERLDFTSPWGKLTLTVLGMLAGAAFAHNFTLASSPTGTGAWGPAAVGIGLVFCLAVGFLMRDRLPVRAKSPSRKGTGISHEAAGT